MSDPTTVNDHNDSSCPFLWPPLESNPELFQAYMTELGLDEKKWGFSELLGFDEELLALIPRHVIAVIVNFVPCNVPKERERGSVENYDLVDYYMKQTATLDNACGLIACLHALYNHKDSCWKPDSPLDRFYQRAKHLYPAERGTLLEGFSEIQQPHKAFALQGQSVMPSTQEGVQHHYVAYLVNAKNQLVELNGTRRGPHVVAEECTTDKVLQGTVRVIQRRLEEKEITSSLSILALHAKASA